MDVNLLLYGALTGVVIVCVVNLALFYFVFVVPSLKKKLPALIKPKQITVPTFSFQFKFNTNSIQILFIDPF